MGSMQLEFRCEIPTVAHVSLANTPRISVVGTDSPDINLLGHYLINVIVLQIGLFVPVLAI